MDKERFRLITTGKLSSGGNEVRVRNYFINEKGLSTQAVENIFSGRTITLAKDLGWEKAETIQTNLDKLGLATDIRLQLDSACLTSGLVDVSQKENNSSKPEGSGEFIRYSADKINPALFLPRQESTIKSNSGTVKQIISHHTSQWNTFILFIAALYIALGIENYLLHILSHAIKTDIVVTISGIIVFIAIALLMPKLCQPKLLLTIRDGQKNILIIEEILSFSFKQKRYLFRNETGEIIGIMFRGRSESRLEDNAGNLCFSIDKRIKVEEGASTLADRVSVEFISNTSVGSVVNIFDFSRRIFSFTRNKLNKKPLTHNGGNPVFDATGKHIANFNSDQASLYMISPPDNDSEQQQLIMFGWLVYARFIL